MWVFHDAPTLKIKEEKNKNNVTLYTYLLYLFDIIDVTCFK
jgi:hypothetical protein